ncbi:hypothetical protein V2J09_006373 [Rumex salicifolius]
MTKRVAIFTSLYGRVSRVSKVGTDNKFRKSDRFRSTTRIWSSEGAPELRFSCCCWRGRVTWQSARTAGWVASTPAWKRTSGRTPQTVTPAPCRLALSPA